MSYTFRRSGFDAIVRSDSKGHMVRMESHRRHRGSLGVEETSCRWSVAQKGRKRKDSARKPTGVTELGDGFIRIVHIPDFYDVVSGTPTKR